MKNVKTIFFDMDGTLIQSEFGIYDSILYALDQFGYQLEDRSILRKFIGPPLYNSFNEFLGFAPEDAERAVALYRDYYDAWLASVRQSAGALPALTDYLSAPWVLYLMRFLQTFMLINLALCIFNLLPIPPLDGYHVVNDIVLRGKLHIPSTVTQYLLIGLMILMFFTSFISTAIGKAVYFVQDGVVDLILAVFGLR